MKAYIYKIKRKDYEFEVYIGQTIMTLKRRFYDHCIKKCNPEFKEWINQYGKNNIEILPIEYFEYNYTSEIENILNERELYWTNYYKNNSEYKVFNKSAGNTGRSNNIKNKKPIQVDGIKYKSISEYIRQGGSEYKIRKEYYKNKEDKIKKYQKEYNKEYRKKNKEKLALKNKEYRKNNEEKITEYHKDYIEKNEEKIKKYQKEYYNRRKNNSNL